VPRCYRCGKANDDFRTCSACRRQGKLAAVWSRAAYEGAAKDVVYRLKFARARAGADVMAGLMAGRLPAGTGWLVTYAPTAAPRVRGRGYDQAALIARSLARQMNLPYTPLLARQGQQRQVGQTGQSRRIQMARAFRPLTPKKALGKHILLIDDVITTGSTLEAAAKTLLETGAKRVSAAVFAAA
jgi:ComF family protein